MVRRKIRHFLDDEEMELWQRIESVHLVGMPKHLNSNPSLLRVEANCRALKCTKRARVALPETSALLLAEGRVACVYKFVHETDAVILKILSRKVSQKTHKKNWEKDLKRLSAVIKKDLKCMCPVRIVPIERLGESIQVMPEVRELKRSLFKENAEFTSLLATFLVNAYSECLENGLVYLDAKFPNIGVKMNGKPEFVFVDSESFGSLEDGTEVVTQSFAYGPFLFDTIDLCREPNTRLRSLLNGLVGRRRVKDEQKPFSVENANWRHINFAWAIAATFGCAIRASAFPIFTASTIIIDGWRTKPLRFEVSTCAAPTWAWRSETIACGQLIALVKEKRANITHVWMKMQEDWPEGQDCKLIRQLGYEILATFDRELMDCEKDIEVLSEIS